METVVTPVPGPSVVATSDMPRDGWKHGDDSKWDRFIGNARSREAEFQTNQIQRESDYKSLSGKITHGTEEEQENYAALSKQLGDSTTATVVGFKDAQAIAYQVEGRALLEAAKNASLLGIQATANFNAVTVQADKNFYQTSLEAVKNASAAELTARTLAAEAARQAAECCCELKALIKDENEKTRDLINANTTQDLRDRLASKNTEIAALFARNVPPPSPV